MSEAIDDFARQYAAESRISLSNPPSALLNKNRGISKGRMNACGLDVPVGISNKPFVYAFIDVVIRMASVVKINQSKNGAFRALHITASALL